MEHPHENTNQIISIGMLIGPCCTGAHDTQGTEEAPKFRRALCATTRVDIISYLPWTSVALQSVHIGGSSGPFCASHSLVSRPPQAWILQGGFASPFGSTLRSIAIPRREFGCFYLETILDKLSGRT